MSPSGKEREDQVGVGVNALGGGVEVGRSGGHDVGNEGLRVAVVEGEPSRLDLDYDFVAPEKGVVRGVEAEFVFFELVGGDGRRVIEAGAIAAAEDFCVDDELVVGSGVGGGRVVGSLCDGHRGIGGVFVDEFDNPVGVRAGGGGEKIGDDVDG